MTGVLDPLWAVVLAAFTVSALGGAVLVLVLDVPTPLPGASGALVRFIAWVRLARGPLIPSLVAGGLGWVVAPLVGLASNVPAALAAATGLAALAITWIRLWPYARLQQLLALLVAGADETRAVSGIVAILLRLRPAARPDLPVKSAYPELSLLAAARLIERRHFVAAARLCAELPEAWLTPEQSTLRANNLALCRIRIGDLPGAREALERARPPERPSEARILSSTRAMLLALDGRAEAALAIVDDPANLDPATKLTLLLARAHACAALGQEARVEATLDEIERDFGAPMLEALAHPPGPATASAARRRGVRGSVG